MTRVAKNYRGKPLPVSDLQAIAKFRAELTVYGKLRDSGVGHDAAARAVFENDTPRSEVARAEFALARSSR